MTNAIVRSKRTSGTALAGALILVAVAPAARAATEQELEAKLDALATQVAQLQSELAALKAERAPSATPAPAASTAAAPRQVADEAPKLDWFGYGELNYSRPSDDGSRAVADVGRFVLGAAYRFDTRTRFVSELEIEHAVSSAEDPGEVEVEQAYIERAHGDRVFGRYGLFLMPVGMLNENHEPTRYYGVFRNAVETAIIPTTWREGGVAFQGNLDNGLRWDAGVSTGFNLSKWDATSGEGRESPLGSIHQELALASAGDLSVFAALNYSGVPGLRVGGSVFHGNSAQGQPGLRDNDVTLWEGHVRWNPGKWELSALSAHGRIANTAAVNLPLVGNPTLIPAEFFGQYVEGAYRASLKNGWTLAPFARYEVVNTASEYANLGFGLTPDALRDEKIGTAGVNLTIASGVVFKFDYRDFKRDAGLRGFDVGVGYQF
ncbi:MAG TPA: bZIP transcription factor [Gammaproteobacteria bacterium]|nr:bZIP transcription factor [Gammaproteobacteria bacterium]